MDKQWSLKECSFHSGGRSELVSPNEYQFSCRVAQLSIYVGLRFDDHAAMNLRISHHRAGLIKPWASLTPNFDWLAPARPAPNSSLSSTGLCQPNRKPSLLFFYWAAQSPYFHWPALAKLERLEGFSIQLVSGATRVQHQLTTPVAHGTRPNK